MHLCRVRILIRATDHVALPGHQAGALYALTAAAYGFALDQPDQFPEGFLLDAPEQCRSSIERDANFAFGYTMIARDGRAAADELARVVQGLQAMGTARRTKGTRLRGNFIVTRVEDLIARELWDFESPLVELPDERVAAERFKLDAHRTFTLDFETPLRMRRTAGRTRPRHRWLDGDCFEPGPFLGRVHRRMEMLNLIEKHPTPYRRTGTLTSSDLVWLDLGYGPMERRKTLGGAVGRVVLQDVEPNDRMALVLGQYAGAGNGTRFGLGRYRIAELGPEPYACTRAVSLERLAFTSYAVSREAERHALPSGELTEATQEVAQGTYSPAAPMRIDVETKPGKVRSLRIPKKRDMALQRLLNATLLPGIECLLEDASIAFRPGLGRVDALSRIHRAQESGYAWAVKSDFADFYNNVPHDLCELRLRAFLRSPSTASLIMNWVRSAMAPLKVGLPTGAPLSPLLANVVLDAFDEAMLARGALLIRYADDFVVLTKTEEEAQVMYQAAKDEARALALALNESKSSVHEIGPSLEFLGFTFEYQKQWNVRGDPAPTSLGRIGWEARTERSRAHPDWRLPGEVSLTAADPTGDTGIVGSDIVEIDAVRGNLVLRTENGEERACGTSHIDDLVVLGHPSLSRRAIRYLIRRRIPLSMTGKGGRDVAALVGEGGRRSFDVVAAQVDCVRQAERTLPAARELIASKIANHAALIGALGCPRKHPHAQEQMRAHIRRAESAISAEVLVGVEGAAAALWYELFPSWLPSGWSFPGRRAPRANDPVNVLLNIAQTALHRVIRVHVVSAGLLPELGVLHRPRSGHDALVSDLQEPFRHLMDRCVLDVMRVARSSDFRKTRLGPFRVSVSPRLARRLRIAIHEGFHIPTVLRKGEDPLTYHGRIRALARAMRRYLVDPTRPAPGFRHP